MPDIEQDFINMYDLIICLTNAVDLISTEVNDHHQQVAYLALKIAEQAGLPSEQKKSIVLASLLHDVGALSLDERLELIEDEPLTAENHALRGAWLMEGFEPLKNAAEIIRYHHVPWGRGKGRTFMGAPVPAESHLLHLADRIAVQPERGQNIISQINRIRDNIWKQRDSVFMPELVDAFFHISGREYIWLDAVNSPLQRMLPELSSFGAVKFDLDETVALTKIFASIIDFRSPFTANHSAGVAKTAEKLAELSGFSENECKMMHIAGNLHDLGKLAVKREVLEKPAKLEPSEIDEIRSHTYYTYRLLEPIKGFETINEWASFHHEKLNGKGYPFHLDGENLSLGSRIMAVADIFTAITEDRPYRKSMSAREAAAVLDNMVKDQSICPKVVSLLMSNFETIDEIRRTAQEKAAAEYNYIMKFAV